MGRLLCGEGSVAFRELRFLYGVSWLSAHELAVPYSFKSEVNRRPVSSPTLIVDRRRPLFPCDHIAC